MRKQFLFVAPACSALASLCLLMALTACGADGLNLGALDGNATSTGQSTGTASSGNTTDTSGGTVAGAGEPTTADSNSTTSTQQAANGNTNQAAQTSSTTAHLVMGVLPDYDNSSTKGLPGYISRTGITPMATSGYVNVGPSGSIETSTGLSYIQEAATAKVPIISLSMTAKQKGSLTSSQLAGISSMIAQAKKLNIQLNLRYGYEMNYGGGDGQFANINENNNPADFKTQWAQVAALANPSRAANPSVKMMWSPNIASGGTLPYTSWLPANTKTIDIVGVDWYHSAGDATDPTSITKSLKDIYAIADSLQVPFYLGETAVKETSTGSTAAQAKITWLTALLSPTLKQQMPLYAGFFWFDYIKGGTYFSISQDSAAVPLFKTWYPKYFGSGT